MTPQDETKDLIKNPIPYGTDVFTACPKYQVLKNIHYLTETISDQEAHLDYLKRQLEQLKSRAIAEDIKDDDQFYLLKIPGKKMRNPIQDLEAFEKRFPQGYKTIRVQQATDIFDKFTKDTKNLEQMAIPLGIADKKIGEDLVTEFVGFQPQKVSIEVRRKQEFERVGK